MNSNNQENQSLMILKILWGALLMSQVIFGFGLFTVLQGQEPLTEVSNTILPIMASMALVAWFLGYKLPGFILKGKRFAPGSPINDMVVAYQTPFILRLALFESATLMGFALGFTFRNFNYFLPFVGISVLAFLSVFPSEENIKKAFH